MATRPSVLSPTMRRYIIWLILALLAMVILYDCARRARERQAIEATSIAQRDYAEILDEGRLRLLVGYDAFGDGALDSASRANSRGEEGGWIFRFSRLVAPQGIILETLLEDNAQRALDELRRGAVDIIALPMLRTMQVDTLAFRWVEGRTSGPLYLVQRQDSLTLTRQMDLSGRIIHLPNKSQQRLFIEHLSQEMGEEIHIQEHPLYNTEQLISMVQASLIDYTLCTSAERERYEALYPDLNFALPVSHSLRQGWLIRASSPRLADSIGQWMSRL